MKRRQFIKGSMTVGSAVLLPPLIGGCGDSEADTAGTGVSKGALISMVYDRTMTSQTVAATLTPEEMQWVETMLPGMVIGSGAFWSVTDALFVVQPNALRLRAGTISTEAVDTKTYAYTTTMQSDTYCMHMFYRKLQNGYVSYDAQLKSAYEARGIVEDTDDIDPDSPPKFELAALALVIPNGTSEDESITFTDPLRETAKALIYSAPVFHAFSQEALRYAYKGFDTIFSGYSSLELMMKMLDPQRWFRYQVYRNADGTPLLRKSETLDDEGNVIHAIGDAIYTFPMRDLLNAAMQKDIRAVMRYFSADATISPLILKRQQNSTTRSALMAQEFRVRGIVYDGANYGIDTSSLKTEGSEVTLDGVDDKGLHVTVSNAFNRHLQVSALFFDEAGGQVPHGGSGDGSEASLYTYAAGMVSPRYALMAIPVADAKRTFTVPMPDGAVSAKIMLGSLSFVDGHRAEIFGQADSTLIDAEVGMVVQDAEAFTIAFEMAVQSLMIAWGARLNRSASFKGMLLTLGAKFAYDIAAPFLANPDVRGRAALMPILAKMGTTLLAAKNELATILISKIAQAEAEDSIPIAGQILRAINVAVDVAVLTETIADVSIAHAVSAAVVTRSHAITLQLRSDPDNNAFPLGVDTAEVILRYAYGTAPTVVNVAWSSLQVAVHTSSSGTYETTTVVIADQPAGGSVDIAVRLKRGNWVAATASAFADNLESVTHDMTIKQNVVPLGASSLYQQYARLQKTSSGPYAWAKATASQPLASPGADDTARGANLLFEVTLNDPFGALGYSYRSLADNTFVVRNISAVVENADLGVKLYSSTSEAMRVRYSPLSHNSDSGHLAFHSYDGAVYVRPVSIDPTSNDFSIDFTHNVGRFLTDTINRFAYYPPERIIAGLDTERGVIHILRRRSDPIADSDSNRYTNAMGMPKTRILQVDRAIDPTTQYLYSPQLLTISPTGTIVILETTFDGPVRLRAFDRYGAVMLDAADFNNGSGVFHLQSERLSVTYLDIGLEAQGYIYVLKLVGSDPTNTENYVLDIYDTQGTNPSEPLVSTPGVSAAKMGVDHWRNVYTLNYETIGDGEPSLSIWVPPAPAS